MSSGHGEAGLRLDHPARSRAVVKHVLVTFTELKNIQIIDGALNATFSVFQATEEEFAAIFPAEGQDMELIEDFVRAVGEEQAGRILWPVWERPILKRDARGENRSGRWNQGEWRVAPRNCAARRIDAFARMDCPAAMVH